jgi:hypothetical protein
MAPENLGLSFYVQKYVKFENLFWALVDKFWKFMQQVIPLESPGFCGPKYIIFTSNN